MGTPSCFMTESNDRLMGSNTSVLKKTRESCWCLPVSRRLPVGATLCSGRTAGAWHATASLRRSSPCPLQSQTSLLRLTLDCLDRGQSGRQSCQNRSAKVTRYICCYVTCFITCYNMLSRIICNMLHSTCYIESYVICYTPYRHC
jgi:hypothetical protein